MPQNAAVAARADQVVGLQHKTMAMQLWICSIKKALDEVGFAPLCWSSSSLDGHLSCGWTFLLLDALQSGISEMHCDALVAAMTLKTSGLCHTLVCMLTLLLTYVLEQLCFLFFGFLSIDASTFSHLVQEMILGLQEVSDAGNSQRGNLVVTLVCQPQVCLLLLRSLGQSYFSGYLRGVFEP